jgi:hypothetical protein
LDNLPSKEKAISIVLIGRKETMDKKHNLYESSLEQGWNETKTYDINKLFLVAFFGGVIPILALGIKNAKWLKVSLKWIYPLIAFGVILLLAKYLLYVPSIEGEAFIDNRTVRFGYKAGSIILFLLFKLLLNKAFKQHLVTQGETEPLLKDAIVWIVMGGIIEVLIGMFISPDIWQVLFDQFK